MLEVKRGRDLILNVFDNINEFTKYITTKPRKSGRDNSSQDIGEVDFYGTETFEEALELIKHGDDELFEKVKKERAKLNVDKILGNAKRRPEYFNNLCGFMPNVPAYLVGAPNNMIDIKKERTASRILNIFLNIRVCGGVSADTIVAIGTKYLILLEALEQMGYRCNLYTGIANYESGGHHSCLMIRVKTDKEPLNIKKICFTIANPSMQRRMKFRWMEVNDGEFDFTDGYGGSESENYIKDMLNKELRDNFMIWNYESVSRGTSVESMLKMLEQKGIKIIND